MPHGLVKIMDAPQVYVLPALDILAATPHSRIFRSSKQTGKQLSGLAGFSFFLSPELFLARICQLAIA